MGIGELEQASDVPNILGVSFRPDSATAVITLAPKRDSAYAAYESWTGRAGSDAESDLSNATDKARLPSLAASLRALMAELSPRRRWQLGAVLVLMLFGALGELLTLGALIPLLAAMSGSSNGAIPRIVAPILASVGLTDPQQLLYAFAAAFAAAALLAAVLRIVLLWSTQRFTYGVARDLGVKLYSDTLAQPYVYHTTHNTSEIIASINKVEIVTNSVLTPLMGAAVATVIATAIVVGLVLIDPAVATIAGIGFVVIYLAASLFTRRRLRTNGRIIAQAQDARVRAMQEGLGGIRDVLLDRSQAVFVRLYSAAEHRLRSARSTNAVLANSPRFVVEAVGMMLVAVVAVAVAGRPGGLAAGLPVLGALAMGAQRLLPLVQQIYLGWASALGNQQIVQDLVALLRRPSPVMGQATERLPFEQTITLEGVGYSYDAGRVPALKGVSIEIPKGARVGIAGRSGSGKSTLMDLVIGLLEPGEGEIRIDGTPLTAANRAAWQRNVAHVPQAIFLADTTIAENIAFGVPAAEIDHTRVQRAAAQAELADVVAALPQGYDTRVGERGIQLSGGQRQRIGIARALYKEAEVLVFDEATSALDHETEAAVMRAIDNLDRKLTIILIAHRVSTLEGCDLLVRLEGGEVQSVRRVGGGGENP